MASQAQRKSLRSTLERRAAYGRSCVPVLGSGVNIQAAAMEGVKDTDDWMGLLWKVAGEIGLTKGSFRRLPGNPLAKWESLLRGWAIHKKVDPYKAETELQKFVCGELRAQEKARHHHGLYGEILDAGYRDIISLNFDRRLALHSGRERFYGPPRRPGLPAAGEALYRYSFVDWDETPPKPKKRRGRHPERPDQAREGTVIWYPHGDTRKTATLKLGVRNYGYYIAVLEQCREHLMGTWRLNDGAHRRRTNSAKPYPLVDMIEFTRRYGRVTGWFDLVMGAPLVFIGCSLAPDEWPMWWLLHQRARNAAPFPPSKRPATYVLVVGDPPEHLQGRPCDIEVVRFPSFDRMWSFTRKALAA